MTDGERMRGLFERARALPAEQRDAFLERECGGDAALRDEVAALLAADERVDGDGGTAALEDPVAAIAEDLARRVGSPAPERLGPYRIVETLGEGGMGVVYRAEQDAPIRRQVALKLIRGGFDSSSIVTRFEIERQALALMDHPNIARLYDAGTSADDSPWFAMEYVLGVPITEFCEEKRLAPSDRLKLFIQVCAGVQHAHHKGIIHRDLKPSNILVTPGDAVPKIIDFGIAKAVEQKLTDRSLATRAGAVVGTLEYMSPEQASGRTEDIDLRSDVYSLGVVLFEILSGKLPCDITGASWTEAVRRITDESPKRLSTIDRRFRGDLETIVLKALEKERARRYPSPGALADDIGRFLAGEPILARPPSVTYQARKLIGRHKAASALVVFLLLVVAGGFVLNIAERRRAEREAATASKVSELLLNMFQSADPFGVHGPDLKVRKLIDNFDETRLEGLEGLPEVEYRIRRALGRAYKSLGSHDQERAQFLRCEELLLEIGGPAHPALSELWFGMGWNLHELARYEESRDHFLKAMEQSNRDSEDVVLFRRAQAGLADTLTHLAQYEAARGHALEALQDFMEEKGNPQEAANVLVNLSLIEQAVGNLDDAQEYARRAVHLEQAPTSMDVELLAARQLGNVLIMRGDCVEAETMLGDQLATLETRYPPGHASSLLVRSLLGESLMCQERYDEAETVLRRIDPDSPGFNFLDKHETADALDRLARVYERLGDREKTAIYRDLAAGQSPLTP